MKTAIRRHHFKRLKKARNGYWLVWGGLQTLSPRRLGMAVATPHPCSASCCGTPRKYFNEKTMQERRYFQDDRLS